MNQYAATVTACLKSAQLLPPHCVSVDHPLGTMMDCSFQQRDLIPLLVAQWKTVAQRYQHRSEKQSYTQRWRILRECQARGGKLLMDAGFHFGTGFKKWLGWRFAWYPVGIPTGQLVGIASSRLGRRLDEKPGWFQKLRQYCQQLDPHTQLLHGVSQTAAAPYVTRAAKLFNLPCLQTTIIDADRWRYWGQLVWDTSSADQQAACWTSIVSPAVAPDLFPVQPAELENTPAHDRTLISASNRLLICQLRPQGILQQLMSHRVASQWSDPGTIQQNPTQPGSCHARKKNGHFRQSSDPVLPVNSIRDSSNIYHINNTGILRSPWEYLSHWTRRQNGPWPDQDRNHWLDELILEQPGRKRSALDSLRRIVGQQRLLATNTSIRGSHQVVCFTATPLACWPSLRTYRAHRGRWDFEPYGICIKRRWLEQVGARPVIYGNDDDWKQLANHQRPFFQQRFSHKPTASTRCDWAIEQEWRYPKTLCLKNLPSTAGFLFVPTKQQASMLAGHSHWPIIYLGTDVNQVEQEPVG